MSIFAHTPSGGVHFQDVEAPLALCSSSGEVRAITDVGLALLRRLGVIDSVPSPLPDELWEALEETPLGEAVEWRPPTDDASVLGCTRHRRRDGFLLLMKEVSGIHVELSRRLHRQRLESTGRLVASIAHELRNAVSSIVYSADFLTHAGSDLTPESQGEAIEEIVVASTRLRETVDGLLDYARLGPGVSVPVSLGGVLNRAQGFLRGRLRKGPHVLQIEVAADADCVQGNSISIEQIFVNLLLNSTQAATGPMTVRIESSRAPWPDGRPGEAARVCVRDDGPGIPERIRRTVFQPFFTTRPEGTGLGLTTARDAAESLGGLLDLEPSTDGACFVVYLPLGSEPRA